FNFPKMVMGNSTFSNADIVASKLKVWNTNPIVIHFILSEKRMVFLPIFSSLKCAKNASLELLSILVPNNSNTSYFHVLLLHTNISSSRFINSTKKIKESCFASSRRSSQHYKFTSDMQY